MKKITNIILALIICLNLFSASAYAASASASGTSSAEVGDTITVTLYLNGNGIHGLQGKLNYDSDYLAFEGMESAKSGWYVESYGSNFVAYDNYGEAPINGGGSVLYASFEVLDGAAGETVYVTFSSLVATDSKSDISAGSASYSCYIEEEETTTTEPTTTKPTTTKPTTTKPAATKPATTKPATTKPVTTAVADSDDNDYRETTTVAVAESVATKPAETTKKAAGETTTKKAAAEATTKKGEVATSQITTTEVVEPTTETMGNVNGEKCNKFPWWILIILLLLVIAVVVYYYYKKKRNVE